MRVVERFEEIPSKLAPPIAATIGSFDGLHLGHQAIFKRLRELAGPTGTTAVITFSNHPSDILSKTPTPLIYPPDQKLALLKTLDIDLTVFLTFTKQTASNTYDQFLLSLKKHLPFDHLVLGSDAVLGKGRTGTPNVLRAFAKTHNFQLEYIPHIELDGAPISSTRIRTLLSENKTLEASRLLGR